MLLLVIPYEWDRIRERKLLIKKGFLGLPWWHLVVKNPPASLGDASLIPDAGRFHMPQSS